MTEKTPKVLVIGYGNPARGDDGLGPAFARAFEEKSLPGLTVDCDYQLTVEDAAAVAEHDVVVFVDADSAGSGPWSFSAVTPGAVSSFSSHSVEPQEVLALARSLFDSKVEAYLLGIRGYDFAMFRETLTEAARSNLAAAEAFFQHAFDKRCFQEMAGILREGAAPTAS